MVQPIGEPEAVTRADGVWTWCVVLDAAPSREWRRHFLAEAHESRGLVAPRVWFDDIRLLFEAEWAAGRTALAQIDDWIARANTARSTS
jgi:hypothetical protein